MLGRPERGDEALPPGPDWWSRLAPPVRFGVVAVGYLAGILVAAALAGDWDHDGMATALARTWIANGCLLAAMVWTVDLRERLLVTVSGVLGGLVGTRLVDGVGAVQLVGEIVGVLCAASLLPALVGRPVRLDRTRGVAALAVALLPAAVVAGAAYVGAGWPEPAATPWWRWALPGAAYYGGMLASAPAALTLAHLRTEPPLRRRWWEAAALAVVLAIVAAAVFGQDRDHVLSSPLRPFVVYPVLMWACVRFGAVGASVATAATLAGVLALSASARGPFGHAADAADRGGAAPGAVAALVLFFVTTPIVKLVLGALMRTASDREDRLRAAARREAVVGQRVRAGIEASPAGMAVLDRRNTILTANPALAEMLGHDRSSMRGKDLRDLVHPDDVPVLRPVLRQLRDGLGGTTTPVRYCRPDGSVVWTEQISTGLPGGEDRSELFVQVLDITARREVELALTRRATHDELTGLANRTLFLEHLARALAHRQRHGGVVAVLFCDLDRLKEVNDRHGHATGDAYIRSFAQRLRGAVRPDDVVARHSGDEFLVLLEDLNEDAEAASVATRIIAAATEPMQLGEVTWRGSVSVGVATSSEDTAPDALLARADVAMYRSKQRGRGGWGVVDDAAYDAVVLRSRLVHDLEAALADGSLELHYQPIIDLRSNRPAAVEALLRWRHPELGLLAAGQFLADVRTSRIMVPLGSWVLATACRDLKRMRELDPGSAPDRVFVNVCAAQVSDASFVHSVASAARAADVSLDSLCLEITESDLLEDERRVHRVVDTLAQEGCSWAIDDFGTGYSSINRLASLPVSVLKLDRSLVNDVGRSDRALGVLTAVADLGRSLGVVLVAEGIEREDQLEAVRSVGVHGGQGYLLGRPAPLAGARVIDVR